MIPLPSLYSKLQSMLSIGLLGFSGPVGTAIFHLLYSFGLSTEMSHHVLFVYLRFQAPSSVGLPSSLEESIVGLGKNCEVLCGKNVLPMIIIVDHQLKCRTGVTGCSSAYFVFINHSLTYQDGFYCT